MPLPNASLHKPFSGFQLIAATGMNYAEVAAALGCSLRTIERYATGHMPYMAQYALEALAERGQRKAKARARRNPLRGVPYSG